MTPLILGVAAALSASAAVQGRADFEFRRELAQGRRFHLSNIIGDVQVTGGNGRTVEVTAVKRAGRYGEVEDVTVEMVELDDGVAICVRYPGQGTGSRRSREGRPSKNPCSWDGWNNRSERNDTEVTFTVRVPAGLRLHIGTVSGSVHGEHLVGDLELTSVSGDVSLSDGTGPAIALETVSGDVDLREVRSAEVTGHTVSGEVLFQGPVQDKGSYEFYTTSGNIRLTLPEQPNATLSAATFSGRFSSDLPTTANESRRRRHRHAATWGTGTARLEIESLSGNIAISLARR
ncbi:MAG: DUF4097 family beta strand repeat protein [Gemmatimonadales bacterium]|nr:DUF4097 family beta strand repeat protein [Gemmatimonadales bacterium]